MSFERRSAFRPSRPRRLAGVALVALALALPAAAAEVVEVRAGAHPKFTRVVFELDAPAGYAIEKVGTAKAPMLQVTVDAGSRFHRLSTTGDVRDVKVTAGTRAVATIALSDAGLRVQEMILSNPYRIVLDLYRQEKALAKAPAPEKPAAEKPVPKQVVVKPAPQPAPKPVAEKPAPKPLAAAPAPQPAPDPAKPQLAPAPIAKAEPDPLPVPAPMAAQMPPQPAPALPKPGPAIVPDPAPQAIARVPAPRPAPPKSKSSPVRPKLKPVKPAASESAATAVEPGWLERLSGDPLWMGGLAAGALGLVALGFVAVRRHRALPNDLDIAAIAEEVEGAGPNPTEGFAMDEAPSAPKADDDSSFADLFQEDAAPAASQETPALAAPLRAPAAAAPEAPASSETDSLFDDTGGIVGDDASQGDAPMNQDMDLPVDPSASPPPVMGGAAAPSADAMQMLQDFERRMQTLEAKLDEANEAREKLERQVAAQSEELRVQRAAIARTQRALRTMSRADEDKATEPALREGDTQAKTRVNA